MLFLSPQARRSKELEKFTEGHRFLFDRGQPLGVGTPGQMGTFLGYNLEKVPINHGYQAEEVSRQPSARAFAFKGQAVGPHQNLDTATTDGLGLPPHEITYVTEQTQLQRLPQRRLANRDSSPAPAALMRTRSAEETILPAPAENTPPGSTEKRPELPPRRNVGEVADRVYHLMQHDLILERERATKLGG